MREIKFRVWDGKKIISWKDFTKYDSSGSDYDLHAIFNGDEGGNLELMQYTGLKDKNGKEIFEGDIIRIPQKTNWVVEWIGSGYRYWSYNKENGFKLSEKTKCEIIGNIYENQDLIK